MLTASVLTLLMEQLGGTWYDLFLFPSSSSTRLTRNGLPFTQSFDSLRYQTSQI